jgi:hypothetical protein
MDRLSLKGKAKWPVAFQDKKFDHVKKVYAAALDKAIEEAIDGKMQLATMFRCWTTTTVPRRLPASG